MVYSSLLVSIDLRFIHGNPALLSMPLDKNVGEIIFTYTNHTQSVNRYQLFVQNSQRSHYVFFFNFLDQHSDVDSCTENIARSFTAGQTFEKVSRKFLNGLLDSILRICCPISRLSLRHG